MSAKAIESQIKELLNHLEHKLCPARSNGGKFPGGGCFGRDCVAWNESEIDEGSNEKPMVFIACNKGLFHYEVYAAEVYEVSHVR